jgi:hypothetical protein
MSMLYTLDKSNVESVKISYSAPWISILTRSTRVKLKNFISVSSLIVLTQMRLVFSKKNYLYVVLTRLFCLLPMFRHATYFQYKNRPLFHPLSK